MAVLTITAIATPASTSPVSIQLGETCSAFDVVYQDTSDNKYDLADNSDTSKYLASHILLWGGSADDYVIAIPLTRGVILTLTGPTLTQTDPYVLSSTGGKIEPIADLSTNDYVNYLGVGKTSSQLQILNYPSAIQHP